jgi:hypothetical protein
MTPAWWVGVPPAELPVDCGGQTHHLHWSDGALDAVDHTDASGERTLAALGGQSHRCIEIVDAWARHADDLDVLLLGSRGPNDPLPTNGNDTTRRRGRMSFASSTAGARVRRSQSAVVSRAMTGSASGRGVASYSRSGAGPVAAPTDSGEEVAMLLTLGAGFPHRLVATVTASWAQRLERGDDRVRVAMAALQAAFYGRALAAARAWLGDADLDLDAVMCPPEAEPAAVRELGRARLSLPFSWLTDVWARGFTTVAGRFCLAAAVDGPGRWRLSTIAPDFGSAHTIIIDASEAKR